MNLSIQRSAVSYGACPQIFLNASLRQRACQHKLGLSPSVIRETNRDTARTSDAKCLARCRPVCKVARVHSFFDDEPSQHRRPTGPQWLALSEQQLQAFARMARPHNIVPSLLLVMLGAWTGSARSVASLFSVTVWATAMISAGVSVASMVINDYFDFRSGVDMVNRPTKPLPSGEVPADLAVLMSSAIYMAVLIAACMLQSPALRTVVAFSAGITLLYTPLFKKVTAVKNAVVASVIALAPISGALAAGADVLHLQRMLPSTAFAFCAIFYREVLMDVSDMEGDRQAGVLTLPVRLGRGRALAIGSGIMFMGCVLALWGLFTQSPLWGPTLASAALTPATPAAGWSVLLPQVGSVVLVVQATLQLLSQAVGVARSGFDKAAVEEAVGSCRKPIGLAIIILALVA